MKVRLSPCKKLFLFALMIDLKNDNAFYLILKTPFVLKIFRLLSLLFDHVEKMAPLESSGQFQNF